MKQAFPGWCRSLGCVVAIAGVLVTTHGSAALGATQDDPSSVSVENSRPLDRWLEILQSKYGYVITYEDPEYVYDGDLKDVSQEVQTARNPRFSNIKTLVPTGGTLSLRLPATSAMSSSSAMAPLLKQMLESHRALQKGGRFQLKQTGDVFHVVPSEVQGKDGQWKAEVPLLDSAITVHNEKNTDVLESVQGICDALNRTTGKRVYLGSVPLSLLHGSRGAVEASDESARTVLLRALSITGSRLTWSLLYDAGLKSYFLNIAVVQIPTPSWLSPRGAGR